MFDLGGTELLLIGIVALVVVGPKELPTMFRAIGMMTGRAREMAREFTSAMNSAADQTGLQEINKTIKAATNPAMFGINKVKEATGLKTPPVAAKPVAAAKPVTAAAAPVAVAEGAASNPVEVKPAYVPNGATEKLAEDRAALKAKLAEEAAARKLAKANAISNPPGVAPIAAPVAAPIVADVKKPAKARAKPKPKADPAPSVADDAP